MKKTAIPFTRKPKSRRPSLRLFLEHLETRLAPANVDVLSYHYDGLLSGNDPFETALTPASVNTTNFGLLFSQPIDGQAYATPLYKANLAIPGNGTHNVAFVATEHDSVYAFDADTGAQLWQRSFINPAAGVTSIPSGDTSGNIFPEYGITGTPFIDAATSTMYFVTQTKEVVSGTAHYVDRLHAINIATGADRATNAVVTIGDTFDGGPDGGFTDNTSLVVNGTGAGTDGTRVKFNAHWQLQRPALDLVNGVVFIGFAGFNDQNVYHGWIVGYHASDLSLQGFINLSPNARAAGVWQSGGGLATDGTNLFFATGNTFSGPKPGFSTADNNYGETVVKLTPSGSTLAVSDYFTPYNWLALDNGDLDIGSGGTMLLPDAVGSAAHPHLMVETGKTGRLYLIDRSNMGHNNPNTNGPDNVVQVLELGGPGIWGNPSFVQTGPNSGLIFYHGSQAVLKAVTISNGVLSFNANNPATSTTLVFGYPGGQPVVSSNGTATPIVWDLQVDSNTEILRAYNALNLAQELYNSNASSLRDQGGGSVKYIAPTVTNGHVLVGGAASFSVYGVFPSNTAVPAPVTNVAGMGLAGGSQIQLTWTNPTSNNATGLKILRSTNPTTGFNQVALVGRNSTAYTDNGLAPGTQYYYRIVATNQVGDGAPSNTAAVSTRIAAPVVAVVNLTHAEVDLAWTQSGNDHYLVERSFNGGAFMTLANNIPSTTTSYIDMNVTPPGTYTYRVTAFNSNPNDSAVSNVVSITNAPVVIDHSAGFASHSDLTINGNAFTGGTAGANLRLATNLNDIGSAFTNQRLNIDQFSSTFQFRIHDGTNPPADGFTFTIQNNLPTALGGGGGCLGYCNIGNSVAVMFDMYTNGTQASTTNLLVNGVKAGGIDMGPNGIDLKNANVKKVDLSYNGTTLHEVVTDTVTNAVFTHDYTVNIASTIGSDAAFVGFTGACGGLSALQDIETWKFTPGVGVPGAPVNAQAVVNGANVNLSWVSHSVNETGFSVERSDNGLNNFQVIGTATGPRFTDANVSPGNHYYRVRAFNSQGNSPYTNTANLVIGPTSPFTDHSAGFANTSDLQLNGGPTVVNTHLRLTDGNNNEARTAWTKTKVGIQNFSTSYIMQDQGVNGAADGSVFAIQNNDPNQVGGGGGGLGYTGIGKSVAIMFDLYTGGTHNSTTNLLTNGNKTGMIDMGPSGIVLGSNHPLRVDLSYDVTQLTFNETVTDTVTGAIFQHTYTNINIPQIVGGTTAYVGFTGATGGENSIQDVVSWSGRFLDPTQPVSQVGVSASVANPVAGTPISVTVRALDAFNNLKPGYTGKVHLTSSDPQAALPADYTFTAGDNGVHTFTNVILKTAGTQTVNVMDTTMAYITGSASATVTAAAASRLLVLYPMEVTAGALLAFNVTAQDAYGNTAPTYRGTVHLSSSDLQALLSPDGTFTAGDNGTHQFSAAFLTAGMQTLTATDTQTGTIVGTETIKVDPAAAASLTVSGFPSSTTAGDVHPVTVTARDRFGNTASGYRGTVHLTSSDPQAVLPTDYTFTAADNGVHTLNVTLKTAGTQSITATDTATASISGTQGGIIVNPAAASTLQVSGFPSPATAGAPGAVVVAAVDAYGNVATGYTGTVHLMSSDPQASLQADHTFTAADNGRYSFGAVLFTAGTQSLTATDIANPAITGTQSGIVVNAAAAATLVMSSFPSPTTAGDSADVTVTLYDAYGNTATGYTGTVSFFSTDPQADLPADYTFTSADQGSHTFTVALKTAGTQSLGVFDVANPAIVSEQDGIEVDPAAARMLMVAGFPSPVTAGTPGQFVITVQDAYGNTVTTYTGTVAIFSSDPQADIPGNYTFTPDDQGSHTFTATLFTAGTQSIGAVDVRDGTISGAQEGIQVLPADASSLRVSGFPSPTTAGTPGRFAVTAFDPYGNVATGYTGTVSFSSSDPQAGLPDPYTFTAADGGVHFFMATLNTAGTQSLTASDADAGISGTQSGITVLAGGAPGAGGVQAEIGQSLAATMARASGAGDAATVSRPFAAVVPMAHARTTPGDDGRSVETTLPMTVRPGALDLVLADWDAGLVHGLLVDDLVEVSLLHIS